HNLGILTAIPVGIALLGMLTGFGYGLQSSLKMKDSSFPARMFTLPVHTVTLVGWPMLHGAAAVALTWFALAVGVLRACGIEAPSWQLALITASVLAWCQAITWSPCGSSWLKAILAILGLSIIVAGPIVVLHFDVPLGVLPVIPAVFLPLSCGIAFV